MAGYRFLVKMLVGHALWDDWLYMSIQFGKWVILPERGTCSHKNVFPLKFGESEWTFAPPAMKSVALTSTNQNL